MTVEKFDLGKDLEQKIKLNQQLKDLVKVINEKSKDSFLNTKLYDQFTDLIEQGAICKVTKKLAESIFKFKFSISCRDAKRRCNERENYKHVKYLLGESKTAYKEMKKKRPDLYETGIKIVKEYLEESIKAGKMAQWVALCFHRTNDKGNYEWKNIQFLPVDKHRELTSKPQNLVKIESNSIGFSVFPSIRALSQNTGMSDSYLRNHTARIISVENHGKFIWFDNQTLKNMKKPFMEILKGYKQSLEQHKESSGEYITYNFLNEILYSVAIQLGFIKEKEQ